MSILFRGSTPGATTGTGCAGCADCAAACIAACIAAGSRDCVSGVKVSGMTRWY